VTAESRTDPRKKNFGGCLGDVPITRIVAKKSPPTLILLPPGPIVLPITQDRLTGLPAQSYG